MRGLFDQELTIEKALEIQSTQLSEWKKVLKEEIYDQLEKWAKKYNNHQNLKTGYQVTRGSDLSNFIHNIMLGHKAETITQTLDLTIKSKVS